VLRGDQPADDRLLPDREPDAMSQLQGEGCLLVRKSELLRAREGISDLSGGGPGLYAADGVIEVIAATGIGVDQRLRSAADGERAVVAGAIAVVGVQDVEEDGITRSL